MNTGQPDHICFYSNKCQWSKAFLTELATTPWKQSFRFVCVDPSPNRPAIPSWLTKVPALVIKGESQPRTDGEVMNWLSEMKLRSGGAGMSGAAPGGLNGVTEYEAYNMMEHQSFAKGFGYSGLDTDTSTQGNGGSSIPGAFSFLNGAAAPGDRTGSSPSMADTAKRSKKEQMMDQQMEDYIKERNRGIPQGPPRA